MNIPKKTILLLTSAALFASTSLSAVTTDPVGYVTISGGAGQYLINAPLVKSPVFSSAVNAEGNTLLSFDSEVPTLSGLNYVQVTSGTLEGTVVDIVSSTTNTVTLSMPLPVSIGDTVLIRPHFLIEDLGTGFADGSTITIYNSDGSKSVGQFNSNILFTGWSGDSSEPIYPGEGFVLITSGDYEIVNTGHVSVNPVSFSATANVVNLVGALDPSSADPEVLFANLPGSTTISVYAGSSLSNPTTYTRAPEIFGGAWEPPLSGITIGDDVAVVVISPLDAAIPLPAAF